MMYEDALGSNSKWYGYLKTLPKTFDTPMFWKEEELEELKGTDIEGEWVGLEKGERVVKIDNLIRVPEFCDYQGNWERNKQNKII